MTEQTPTLPKPRIKPASSWSAIWILPLIALAIGGWLGWKAYNEAGVMIEIEFASGDGLQAGKTELYYKGIALGKVKTIDLDQKTQKVTVGLEVDRTAKDFLRKNTVFWLVSPQISLAGVTGLETLVSGNYIAMHPGDGKEEHKFVALIDPPPLADALPGLHLKLNSDKLGSLSEGSPVYYRQIQVGTVTGYSLDSSDQSITIKLHIEPDYAQLVNSETRFWNASGFSVSADLSGVKIDVESLLSVAVGGIAFDTPPQAKNVTALSNPNPTFKLYENYKDAQAGISIEVYLSSFAGVQPGKTQLRWNGFTIGVAKQGHANPDLKGLTVEFDVNPNAKPWLTEDAQFWFVEPQFSLDGLSGLDAILSGNYVELKPGNRDKPARRSFTALASAPPPAMDSPGLHLVLNSTQAASLKVGSPILFRQLVVGSVSNLTLATDQQQVNVAIHIQPQYSKLVNSSTRFWNASGITLNGSLSGFQIRSESLAALINGGIAFETPQPKAAAARNGNRFTLHADQASANRTGERIALELQRGDGLRVGTPVRYRGFQVGAVDAVALSSDLQSLQLQVMLTESADLLARAGTTFSVIRPELSLTNTANLDTLITGPYIEVTPANNPRAAKQTRFKGAELTTNEADSRSGLKLSLSTPQRKSLKPGMAVTYRGMAVGTVTDLELSQDATSVLVHVLIQPRFTTLVRGGSKFWNESGINVDFSLFKGAQVRTDSMESLLQGSIAFATPDDAQQGQPAQSGRVFVLYDEVQDAWLKWRPRIAIGK